MNKKNIIKRISFIAAFGAISAVLYCFLKFPLPIFPSFLDINFSMIPIIICAFMLGPWDAAVCVILRCLVKWIYPGTGTGYVGEIADVLIGLAASIPAGFIYHKTELKRKTVLAFALVVVCWGVMGVLSNIFINIPWYSNFYFHADYYKTGVPEPLVGMVGDAVQLISFGNLTVTKSNFMLLYIVLAVIPFNLMLSLIVVLITAPIHKRLRVLYDWV